MLLDTMLCTVCYVFDFSKNSNGSWCRLQTNIKVTYTKPSDDSFSRDETVIYEVLWTAG